MGKSDSLEHLSDVHGHQGEAEGLGQVPEGLEHLDPQEAELGLCSVKKVIGMGNNDSLKHLPDVHRHLGEAE